MHLRARRQSFYLSDYNTVVFRNLLLFVHSIDIMLLSANLRFIRNNHIFVFILLLYFCCISINFYMTCVYRFDYCNALLIGLPFSTIAPTFATGPEGRRTSVALLVARRIDNRKVAGSRPAKVVTSNRLG